MIEQSQLQPIGRLGREPNTEFFFLLCDGLPVPFRSSQWRQYIGRQAYLLRTDLEEEDDSLYDLIGMTLEDTEYGAVGVITKIDDTTSNLLIELDKGTILPLHEDFIQDIIKADKRLIVTMPKGLL